MIKFFSRAKLAAFVVGILLASIPSQAKAGAASENFQVNGSTKIAVGTNRHATLADVKLGDHVNIVYATENGALVAHHIADNVPRVPRKPTTSPTVVAAPPNHPAKKPSPYSHVHGIVDAVDAQAGTLTISYKVK